jgi:hypothetical protein
MMTRPRFSAALSLVLLALLAVCIAQATLFVLLLVMSRILGVSLGVEVGPAYVLVQRWMCCGPQVMLFNAATVGSFLFTSACGVGAAISTLRSWQRPA